MECVILGGGIFLGYWLKRKIIHKKVCLPVIIDYPRNDINVFTSRKDVFFFIDKTDYRYINRINPEFIIFNFYDLFDPYSIDYAQNNNNIIMFTINKLLDIADRNNSRVYVLANINRYKNKINTYQNIFNEINDTYIKYLEIISDLRSAKTKVILLPNVYGPYEPKRAIIRSIFLKILASKELILTKTSRDFLYINDVVDFCYNEIFDCANDQLYLSLSSGINTMLVDMYNKISKILEKQTKIKMEEEVYELEKTDICKNKVNTIIIKQNYEESLRMYANTFRKSI